MRPMKLLVPLLLAAAVAAVSSCATPPDPNSRSRVADMLRGSTTKDDITLHIGTLPQTCWASGPSLQVCTWDLGNQDAGWKSLAPLVPTDHRVTLVCELPTNGAPRDPRACSAHGRASVSLDYEVARYATAGVSAAAPGGSKATPEDARAVLDAQKTLADLSRLVGSGPERCEPGDGGLQVCAWTLGNNFEGYDLLAAAARTDHRVKLLCKLPLDGRPRAPESCRVLPL